MAKSSTTIDKVVEPEKKQTFESIVFFQRFGVFIFLIFLIIFFASQNPRFLSIRNLLNILTDVSIYGTMGVGMTLVILTAGVDLSVGAILALCGMAGAAAIKGTGDSRSETPDPHKFGGFSWLIALLICAIVGALVATGEGRRSQSWPAEVLERRVRDSGVRVMPAHGLTLEEVRYPSAAELAARAEHSRRLRG